MRGNQIQGGPQVGTAALIGGALDGLDDQAGVVGNLPGVLVGFRCPKYQRAI